MSIEQVFKCDGCGAKLSQLEAIRHSGNWTSSLSGAGITSFHACSVMCGVRLMRANADALEKKEAADKKARDEAAAKAAAAGVPVMNAGLNALAGVTDVPKPAA